MLTKERFDIADPEAYKNEKNFRYYVYYGYAGTARPRVKNTQLQGGAFTVLRSEEIRCVEDLESISELITRHLKKQGCRWNDAKVAILAFSKFAE